MKTKSKIPALRFKGFTDAWEQRKLGELTTSFSGGTPSAGNSSYYKGDIPFIRSSEINSDKTELFLTEAGLKNSSAKMVSVGDILYALYGATSGEVGISQINGAINQAILAIKPCDGYNSHFLMQWLKLQKQKIIDKYLQGGQGNLSGSIVKNLVLNVPSYEEQQKIGSFFKQLDNTIALHQRKCEQTKELKKTMLQKMFPKKGERIPEIRFPEFTDEWEEKKLGEVVEREIKGKAKANMQGTKSIYLETEYLNGGETTFVDSDADIEEDDILILWDGSQAGTVYHGFFGALGSTLKAYRPKESGKFVYYQLVAHQEMIFQRYRTPNIPHVIKTFTDEFSVFTTSLSEQERIGNFFKHLDTLIALHQSKCDSLKELKKTLLRQLFV